MFYVTTHKLFIYISCLTNNTNNLGNKLAKLDITSTIHIACQPSSKAGRLRENFYLINGNNKEDYCKVVLEEYDNSTKGNGSDPAAIEVLVLEEKDYNFCELSDCGDLCDGCSIRFYHNSIDEDEFFAHPQVSKMRKISTMW